MQVLVLRCLLGKTQPMWSHCDPHSCIPAQEGAGATERRPQLNWPLITICQLKQLRMVVTLSGWTGLSDI